MTAPIPPVTGSDWQPWARQLRAFLQRNLSLLQRKDSDSRATEDGIVLWDPANAEPVVSIDGVWVPITTELTVGFDIAQAERVVFSTYGDTVSVKAKAKDLNKFGLNSNVNNTWNTVAEFQAPTTVRNETFVTTNLIDSISSSDAGDTSQNITIEGHTIDGSGNLTFVTQNAALNGQTKVTLTTPLARATRAFVANSGSFGTTPTALAGTVYIYDDTGGIAAGVPVVPAATKLTITAGETQSQKAATTISQGDYYFVSYFAAGVGDAGASANYITVRLERRDVVNGGAWRPFGQNIVLIPGQNGVDLEFSPYLIVPKNHDVRAVAKTDTNTAEIFAEFGGYLALVQ